MKIAMIDTGDRGFSRTVQELLRRLLECDLVGSVMLPKKTTGGDNYVQVLVKNPDLLVDTDPTVPVIPVHSSRLVSCLTFRDPGEKIAVVVKPCEARAIIELTKFLQVSRESLFIIAVDCLGTYEPKEFSALVKSGKDPASDLRSQAFSGKVSADDAATFRFACTICEHSSLSADLADMMIGLWGVDCDKDVYVELRDEMAEQLVERGVLQTSDSSVPGRAECLDTLNAERRKTRDAALGEFHGRINSTRGLQNLISTCIRCHNCMINCPICYCRECVFRSPTFEHHPDQYLGWAEEKGAVRMPTDTLMFHLTRLNHMAMSCVGCGMCDSACPSDIPITSLFRTVGLRAQTMMGYEPGRSYDEPAPATTFRDDELIDESGTK